MSSENLGAARLFEFDYSPEQWRELEAAISVTPRVLDAADRNPWSAFRFTADSVRSALRGIAQTSDERKEYAAAVSGWRRISRSAEELCDFFECDPDDFVRVAWRKLEVPMAWEEALRTLIQIKQFAWVMAPPHRGVAFAGAARAPIMREYYYWLIGAWAALGGPITYTYKAGPGDKIVGQLVRFLRAAADPVLDRYALRPTSLKHVIDAAKKLQPISPIMTRARNGRSARLWAGYKGGLVVVTYVHFRGKTEGGRVRGMP